ERKRRADRREAAPARLKTWREQPRVVRGGDVRSIEADLLANRELYGEVVQRKLAHARESVWIATANVKAMFVDTGCGFRSVLDLFEDLRARGVELRLLHAELPSRPFRAAFERKEALVRGGLCLKVCPRVRFTAVGTGRVYTGRPYGSPHGKRRPAPARRTCPGVARATHGAARDGDRRGAGAARRAARRPAAAGASVLVPGVGMRPGDGLAFVRHHD